mgnify:CR=1 FL=1
MRTRPTEASLRALQVGGFLLPPVLTTEDLRRVLKLRTTSAVIGLHRREGLPLAKVGRRFLVTRQTFQRWLDEQSTEGATGNE